MKWNFEVADFLNALDVREYISRDPQEIFLNLLFIKLYPLKKKFSPLLPVQLLHVQDEPEPFQGAVLAVLPGPQPPR